MVRGPRWGGGSIRTPRWGSSILTLLRGVRGDGGRHHCDPAGQAGTSPPSPPSPLSLLHPTLVHRTQFHRRRRHLCDPTGQGGATPSSAHPHSIPPPLHPIPPHRRGRVHSSRFKRSKLLPRAQSHLLHRPGCDRRHRGLIFLYFFSPSNIFVLVMQPGFGMLDRETKYLRAGLTAV